MYNIKELLLNSLTELDGSIQERTYTAVVCLLKDTYRAVHDEDIDDAVLTDWACSVADAVINGLE